MSKRERQYEHVLASYLKRGYSKKVARSRAAATVNKYRARLARGYRACKRRRGRSWCTTKRGPQLVTRGGSRRQWYPGKRRAMKRRSRVA